MGQSSSVEAGDVGGGRTGLVGPGGAAVGYRPSATLPFAAEFRRQASPAAYPAGARVHGAAAADHPGRVPVRLRRRRRNGRNEFGSLVDLATSGGLNFTLFSIFVSASFLLVVVVALFCGDTVASEASWGSLRYLLAIPVPRARLLDGEAGGRARVLGAGPAAARRHRAARRHPPLRLVAAAQQVAAELAPGEGLLRLLAVLGYLAVVLLVVAGLAFLLSVTTDAALGAVGGAVLLWILSSILDQITALGGLRAFLPTHYSTAWLGLLSTPVQTDDVVRGAISAISYATLFWGLAFWRFTRKDVTS